MQDAGGQHGELAVLNELAQVRQPGLLALRVLLNDADDAVHDGPLVLKAALQPGWGGVSSARRLLCEAQHLTRTRDSILFFV